MLVATGEPVHFISSVFRFVHRRHIVSSSIEGCRCFNGTTGTEWIFHPSVNQLWLISICNAWPAINTEIQSGGFLFGFFVGAFCRSTFNLDHSIPDACGSGTLTSIFLAFRFRSMGILLPPVSQVTNTRINLTQHHRNRSLDSALQRIPEVSSASIICHVDNHLEFHSFKSSSRQVEVGSPSAESENTLCTNSILGATMCSKISTLSSTNPPNTPTVRSSTNIIGQWIFTQKTFLEILYNIRQIHLFTTTMTTTRTYRPRSLAQTP